MKTPRISASSYSNTAPLIWSFLYGSQHGYVELILDNAPARSAELLSQDRVDAALVPVIAYHELEDVSLFPNVCVGARERVRSVCLVTRGMDLAEVRSVALDASSRTSVVLTKIIFREFLGFEPEWRTAEPDVQKMLEENDAALLIGDPALSIADLGFAPNAERGMRNAESLAPPASLSTASDRSNSNSAFRVPRSALEQVPRSALEGAPPSAFGESEIHKYDLAELWNRYTGTGFVFAMWMSQRGSIEINFAEARDEGLRHLDEIVSNYEGQIGMSRDELMEYLSENISFSVDDEMRRGMEVYFELAKKCGLIDRLRPVEYLE